MKEILTTTTAGEAPGAVVSASGGKSTPGTVSGILQNSSPTPTVDFMTQKPDGVFINLQKPEDLRSLELYVNAPIQNGNYYIDFDYDTVFKYLYKTESTSLVFPLKIKIAKKILPVSSEKEKLYGGLSYPDEESAAFYLGEIYVNRIDQDGKSFEEKVSLNIDEIITYLWKQKIRHGIHKEAILAALSENKQGHIVVAGEVPPTETTHSKLEEVFSFKKKQGPKGGDTNANVDPYEYEQGYFWIKDPDTVIFKKIPGILGKPGWKIDGKRIDPEPVQDFDINKYIGDNVKIEIIDGYECICSKISGFPRLETGKTGKNKQGMIRIHVDEKKIFDQIGKETGKISANDAFVSKKDITLDVNNAKSVQAEKDVIANITADEEIIINGNVSGNIDQNQRSMAIPQGRIKSMKGNIKIGCKAMKSYIEAKNGSINIGESQNSTIIGDTIEIGSTHNSLIVGDTVIISGTAIGCQIIAKNIIIGNSSSKRQEENICTIFSHDLSQEITQIEEIMQELNTMIEKMKIGLDHHIGLVLKKFNELSPKQKIGIRGIMMDFIFDTKNRNDINYDQFQQSYTYLEKRIAFKEIKIKSEEDKKHPKWEAFTFTHIHDELRKISGMLDQKNAYMQLQREHNQIIINNTNATTYIKHLSCTKKDLSELTTEEIFSISKHRLEGKITQYCNVTDTTTHSSGPFSWKAT